MKTYLLQLLLLCIGLNASGQDTQEQVAARAGLEEKPNAQIPMEARFRNESGKPTKLGEFFDGKPVLLVLAYFECPNLCTVVLNGLLDTVQDLKFDAGKEYQIVVVSIDPKEGPALALLKKRSYLRRYLRKGAANGWHFLTGDREVIAQLAGSVGYRFAWDEATRQFAHPSVLMVLTPQGRIARYFPGIEYPPRQVRLALIEASQNRVGSLADRAYLLCFHYDPHTGKYGLLIWRVMQIAGCTTVVLLAGMIATLYYDKRRDAASTPT